MTDDHSAARDVIARVGVSAWNGASEVIDFDLWCADQIIAALSDAGWQITRRDPAAGRVCISAEDARLIIDAADVGIDEYTYPKAQERTDQWVGAVTRLRQAITEPTSSQVCVSDALLAALYESALIANAYWPDNEFSTPAGRQVLDIMGWDRKRIDAGIAEWRKSITEATTG